MRVRGGGGGGVAHGEGTVYEHSLNKEAENPGEKGSDPVPRTVLLQIFWDKNETCLWVLFGSSV